MRFLSVKWIFGTSGACLTFAVFPDRQIQTVILIKAAVYPGSVSLLIFFDSIKATLLLLVQKCCRARVEMRFSVREVWPILKIACRLRLCQTGLAYLKKTDIICSLWTRLYEMFFAECTVITRLLQRNQNLSQILLRCQTSALVRASWH